jgi:hypothetical protein
MFSWCGSIPPSRFWLALASKPLQQAAAVAQTDADAGGGSASAIIDCYDRSLAAGKSLDQALADVSALATASRSC